MNQSKFSALFHQVYSYPLELPYKTEVGDGRQKIWIKPQRETNLGVTRALFDQQKIPLRMEEGLNGGGGGGRVPLTVDG